MTLQEYVDSLRGRRIAVLGYGAAEINAALKGVDTGALTTEAIVKAALKNMMK